MKAFHLQIVTPEGIAFEGEAKGLSLRGTEGEIAVLAGHAPLVTLLAPGSCRVYTEKEDEWHWAYGAGALAVTREGVYVALTELLTRK